MATPDFTPLKACSKCGTEYPATVEYFRPSKQSKDGLFVYCRPCCRAIDNNRNRDGEKQRTADKKALTDQGLAKCSECGETKLITEFYAGSKKQNGVKSWCKACYSKRTGHEHKPRVQFPDAPDGYKYCRKCKALKPLADFYGIDTSYNKDGKMSHCSACAIEDNAKVRLAQGMKPREQYPDGYKRCSMCKQLLPITDAFFARSGDKFQGNCKECVHEYLRHPDNILRIRKQKVVSVNKRRARKRELIADLTEQQWKDCLAYWDNRCAVCGNAADMWRFLAQDHWIPVKLKGGTTATNIVPLCHSQKGDPAGVPSCNISKGYKDPIEWLIKRFGKQKAQEIANRINTYFEWVKLQR